MKKIVITGGPCAGKTTAIAFVKKEFENKGYKVLCVPETASELILGGVTPWGMKSLDYQLCQMKLQLYKEAIFKEAAEKIGLVDKTVIICDRGMMDNKAYMTDEDFNEAFKILNLSYDEILNSYDCILHMETAAKNAESFYTLENNNARTETVEEAVALDDRLINAWKNHPAFVKIEGKNNFEEKMNCLLEKLLQHL